MDPTKVASNVRTIRMNTSFNKTPSINAVLKACESTLNSIKKKVNKPITTQPVSRYNAYKKKVTNNAQKAANNAKKAKQAANNARRARMNNIRRRIAEMRRRRR